MIDSVELLTRDWRLMVKSLGVMRGLRLFEPLAARRTGLAYSRYQGMSSWKLEVRFAGWRIGSNSSYRAVV